MDKHTWVLMAGGHELAVERLATGEIKATWGALNMGASAEQALGKEVLRLAEENRALKEFLENGKLRARAVAEAHERALARIAALEAEVERLRGFVVWHRQDGECVRLYSVSDDEERTMASVSFKTGGEAQVIVWRQE